MKTYRLSADTITGVWLDKEALECNCPGNYFYDSLANVQDGEVLTADVKETDALMIDRDYGIKRMVW